MAADFFIGESLVGDGNEVAHIDLIIGSKSGPTGAAFTQALSRNTDGFTTLLAVVTPNLPAKPDPMTKAAFNAVESLPQGARVFVSMDFDPASTPEIEPFYRAVMLHLKRKEARIAIATTWYQAPPLVERHLP